MLMIFELEIKFLNCVLAVSLRIKIDFMRFERK